jgi:hypothetical protein
LAPLSCGWQYFKKVKGEKGKEIIEKSKEESKEERGDE